MHDRNPQQAAWPNSPSADQPGDDCDELRKIYVEITTDCNLDCGMCIRHAWEDPAGSMAVETFETLLSQVREIPSALVLQLGGFGEPTVHPHFRDFLLGVKEAGLRAELVTNGTTLDEGLLEKLVDLQLDRLIVSIDGEPGRADGVFHPGPNGDVLENLRNLYRLKLLRGRARPEVVVQFVAGRRNIDQLPAVKRLALELGFSGIVVTNLIPHRPELADQILYARWTTATGNSFPSPWNPTVDLPRMDARSEASPVIEQLQMTGTGLRVCGNDLSGGGMRCRFVGEGCVAIGPDGGVSPCLPLLHTYHYYFRGEKRRVLAYRVGNIRQTPLGRIWTSEEYRAFRARVRRFEFSPCIDCGGCELRESNEEDCFANGFPCCGECLWAAGLVQCP